MPVTEGKADLASIMKETYDAIQSALPEELRSPLE